MTNEKSKKSSEESRISPDEQPQVGGDPQDPGTDEDQAQERDIVAPDPEKVKEAESGKKEERDNSESGST